MAVAMPARASRQLGGSVVGRKKKNERGEEGTRTKARPVTQNPKLNFNKKGEAALASQICAYHRSEVRLAVRKRRMEKQEARHKKKNWAVARQTRNSSSDPNQIANLAQFIGP